MNRQQLQEQVRWITYQARAKSGGKLAKVPYNTTTAKDIDPHAPRNWTTYATAKKRALEYNATAGKEEGKDGGAGWGVVLNGDGVVCIDIDGCITPPDVHPGTYTIAPHALAILEQCPPTYIELSLRRNGLHIFGTLATPEHETRYTIMGHTVEVYSTRQFIAWTGHNLYSTLGIKHLQSDELANLDNVIDWLEANHVPLPKERNAPSVATVAPSPLDNTDTAPTMGDSVATPRKSTPTSDMKKREDAHYRACFKNKLATAVEMVANATDGAKHDTRYNAGRTLGGYIEAMRRLGYTDVATDIDTYVDAMLDALPPQGTQDDKDREEKAIRDGIKQGMKAALTLVPFDPDKRTAKQIEYERQRLATPPTKPQALLGGEGETPSTAQQGGGDAIILDIPEYDPMGATLRPVYIGQGYALTDIGNSKRMVEASQGNLLYNGDASKWLAWNKMQWATMADPLVMRYAKAVAEYISVEATAMLSDEKAYKSLVSHATKSQSLARINAMMELAKAELYTDMGAFDNNPDHLPCINGVIDLRSGALLPHDRAMHNTKITSIEYDPVATAPNWRKFIDTITGGNESVATYLQMQVGYSLTGHIDQQCLFFLYGHGANGKSTFMNTIAKLAGEYHRKVDMDAILESDRSGGGANPFLVALVGMRMTTGSEFPAGRRINEALVKDLTGGDEITARGLYSNPFSFRPINKYWLMGNHKPRITGTDGGIWRRMVLIPFGHTIPESERKPQSVIEAIFNDELSGILNWAIQGAIAWYQHPQRASLPKPDVISDAITEYRTEEDTVQRFILESCDIDTNLSCTAKDMLEAFHRWLEAQGEKTTIWTQTRLTRELKRMDIAQGGAQKSKYLGIRPRQTIDTI